MDELEQTILEFGWHPDEIKPRDKTWLHERRNWMSETENLRHYLRLREEQVRELTLEVREYSRIVTGMQQAIDRLHELIQEKEKEQDD